MQLRGEASPAHGPGESTDRPSMCRSGRGRGLGSAQHLAQKDPKNRCKRLWLYGRVVLVGAAGATWSHLAGGSRRTWSQGVSKRGRAAS